VTELEKLIESTCQRYNSNKNIKKRKKDIDKIMACKSIRDLLLIRKKLGLMEWK
jgi:hypothetical protein